MYGLEKEKKGKGAFQFDLEREIHDRPNRRQELLSLAEKKHHEVKNVLREGASKKDLAQWDTLLNGYAALEKVLKKVGK